MHLDVYTLSTVFLDQTNTQDNLARVHLFPEFLGRDSAPSIPKRGSSKAAVYVCIVDITGNISQSRRVQGAESRYGGCGKIWKCSITVILIRRVYAYFLFNLALRGIESESLRSSFQIRF